MENQNKQTDTRFILDNEFHKDTKYPYMSFQDEIERNGRIIAKINREGIKYEVKIYNAVTAIILTTAELSVFNTDTQKKDTISGWEYLKTYAKAYKEGEQYFEAEYKVSPDTLYGVNAEQYVKDIHLNYFHIQHNDGFIGWGCVKKYCPYILTHNAIKKAGYYSGIVSKVEEQARKYPRLFATFDKCEHDLPPQQAETKTEQETIEIKPVLKPEAVQIVFDIIKDFFSPEQQKELKQILETGNKASKKMLFKGNGNRLTDTFKKLIEHDFITGCQKQDLINWIISNFTFTQQNKVKAFVYDTVEKTISRNFYPCKSPLIEIENKKIQRVEQPRTKNYSKY